MAMVPLRSYVPGLVVFCLLSLGGPLRAAADGRSLPSPAPDSDPKHVSARDVTDSFEKAADKATSQYRYSDAADLYGRAWDTYRDPTYICNRGSLLLSLKRHIEVAEALSTCIARLS